MNDTGSEPESRRRVLAPRPGLPNGRALLGGLLVAVAVVGTLVTTSEQAEDRRRPHTVLARPVDAGEIVGPDDFSVALMELSDEAAANTLDARSGGAGPDARWVAQVAQAEGTLALGDAFRPVDAVADTAPFEYSLPIEPAHAANGNLAAGMRVDVIATDPDAEPATHLVAANVSVLAVTETATVGNASADTLSILLGFATYDELLAVRTAEYRERIALIDTTRLPDAEVGPSLAATSEEP